MACGCGGSLEGDDPGECADGADNDADGNFDCDDQDCFGSKDCETEDSGTIPSPQRQEPEVSIEAPVPLSTHWLGQPMPLEGAVGDLQQPPDTLTARWRILEDATAVLVDSLEAVPDAEGQIADEWVVTAPGALRIELIVYDQDGNEATAQVSVQIEVDLDADGYTEGAQDCDDGDPSVYVGAEEICDGAIDHDCNGFVDDRDLDADGYVDEACASYYGPQRGDCDDADALIYPGAPEHCDEADEDCDGVADNLPVDGVAAYLDTDGDGWGEGDSYVVCEVGAGEALAGGDCAALDAEVHPGAVEICGSGQDEDCDTLPAPCAFEGALASADFASKLDGTAMFTDVDVGDFDGDGVREVVAASGYAVSNEGRVYVAEAPAGSLSLDSSGLDLELTGRWSDEGFGDAVSVRDVDLDGDDDLLVGGTFGGAAASLLGGAYLFRGPLVSGTYSDQAYLQIYGESAFDQLGHDLVFVEDQTGDALPDLLISASGVSPDGVFAAGATYVFDGASSGTLSPDDASATLLGATNSERVGTRVLDAGDVDGDGQADLLLGAEGLEVGGLYSGGAYLVHGPAPALVQLDADADARIEGVELSYAGRALAGGDLDGDGYSDVVVGAPNYGDGSPWWLEGVACVLQGPLPAVTALTSGSSCIYGGADDEHTGRALALGDLSGDGQLDLVVDFQYGSVLRAFEGPLAGTYGAADAFLTVQGDEYGDRLIPVLADLDDDGANDIVTIADTSVWIGLSDAL